MTHSYYFIIATSGTQVTGAEPHQATFEMVQTAAPATLSASLAIESSLAAASSSVASESASLSSLLSSLSAAGLTVDPSNTAALSSLAAISSSIAAASSSRAAGRSSAANIQNGSGGSSSVPNWAIALIAVFGFLALLAGLVLLWLIIRHMRRRREEEGSGRHAVGDEQDGDTTGGDGSVAGESTAALMAGAAGGSLRSRDPEKSWDPDVTRNSSELEGPRRPLNEKPSLRSLNPGDAALISNAFREVLRKPDFPKEDSGSSKEQMLQGGTKPHPSPDSLGVGTTTPHGLGDYGDRESDSGAPEVGELIGTDVTVRNVESKRPDIHHD